MTATTTETGLERHGIEPVRRGAPESDHVAALHRRTRAGATDGSPREGRWSSTPASSPAARRRTSSSCASRAPRSGSGGATSTVPLDEAHFDGLRQKVVDYLARPGAPLRDRRLRRRRSGASHRGAGRSLPARITRSSRRRCSSGRRTTSSTRHEPEALVLHAPEVEADPDVDGTRTGIFVVLHPSRTEVVIGGTFYAGEIKKSIFTVMNDRLPLEGVFPMHCSANVGPDGDVAIFFGLSGTGKTTLSADPARSLIGDDEHGWGDERRLQRRGRLLREGDPPLGRGRARHLPHDAHLRDDPRERRRSTSEASSTSTTTRKTENTRAAYELEQIPNAHPSKMAGHPQQRRLPHRGRLRDPAAHRAALARSGAVLVPLRVHCEARRDGDRSHRAAADVLDVLRRSRSCLSARSSTPACSADKLAEHGSSVWLVNTGWTGGAFGEGHRMPIKATRALLTRRALGGARRGGVPDRPRVRVRGSRCRPGRRERSARPALDLGRPRRRTT